MGIGGLVVVVLLAVGAYALFGGGNPSPDKEQAVQAPSYQTYSDSDIKLSFEYPATWSVGTEVDEALGSKYVTVYDAGKVGVAQLVLEPEIASVADEPVTIRILSSAPLTLASKTPSYATYGVYQADDELFPIFGISGYAPTVTNGQAIKATSIEPQDTSKYQSIRFEQLVDAHFHDMQEAETYFKSDDAQVLYKMFQSFKLG